jgi:hypothetical protein
MIRRLQRELKRAWYEGVTAPLDVETESVYNTDL